ncbi:MAG: hypothetical protein AAGD25_18035 [Cyanobacteria bacterium P01_F01_bin.150]
MFQPSDSDAHASTEASANFSPAPATSPRPQYEPVRHMLFGRPSIVQATIKHLYALNYAEPNEWSRLMPTGRGNEVMATLTKKVRVNQPPAQG